MTTRIRARSESLLIGVIGHEGQGRSALTEALGRASAHAGPAHLRFVDWPSHAAFMKGLITGVDDVDGVILVVSATEGIRTETHEQLRHCVDLGIRSVMPFIDTEGAPATVESTGPLADDLRALLADTGAFAGATPIPTGNPRDIVTTTEVGALPWVRALLERIAALPPRTPSFDEPFLMPIEDVFTIQGVGTVVLGRITEGEVATGESVDLVSGEGRRSVVVERIDQHQSLPDQGEAGDSAGLLLRGVGEGEIERGSMLTRAGSAAPSRKFKAKVYLLARDEGGRHTPFFQGHRPQFYFDTTDVTGEARLPAGTESVSPGETVDVEVELIAPTVLRTHQRFAIREGGRTIGAGVVVEASVEPRSPVPERMPDDRRVPDSGTEYRGRGRSRGLDVGAEPAEREPERPPPGRTLFADLTLFDEVGTRIDDTKQVLCESTTYTLEVALRRERTGITYTEDPKPAGPVPADTPARLLAVVSARETDFLVGEPVQFIDLAPGIETDSDHNALFRVTTQRRTPDPSDLAELEVRLYYELNLIEHVVVSAEVQRSSACDAGSTLGLDPPIRMQQLHSVDRDPADIVRGLKLRHMSLDLRAVPAGVRFSVTVSSAAAPDVGAKRVSLHGNRDIGVPDLTRVVNGLRELLRDIAMDRFAGVVDGSEPAFAETLRELALQGRDLWSLLFRGTQNSAMWNIGEWIKAHPPAEGALVEVRLLDGPQSFVFPWALLYDGPDPTTDGIVLDGFWGLRYAIEQKPGKGLPALDLPEEAGDGLDLSFMVWEGFPNAKDQVSLLDSFSSQSAGKLTVGRPVDEPHGFYALVEDCDADILYFYAHAHTRPAEADAAYRELERAAERIESLDEDSPQRRALDSFYQLIRDPGFEPDRSWIGLSWGRLFLNDMRAKPMRLHKRPIVILNTCESAQVLPGLADSFVSLFLERNARSVIGTECVMTNQFAHPFAEVLLRDLLGGRPLGEALRRARLHFIGRKNPLGLAYTLYGSGTTRFEPSVLENLSGPG